MRYYFCKILLQVGMKSNRSAFYLTSHILSYIFGKKSLRNTQTI